MDDDLEITLPAHSWKPAAHQLPAWRYLMNGGKRASLLWHRRSGKDEVCLQWTCLSAMERVGPYWHLLPEAEQARKALWDAVNPRTGRKRIDDIFPHELRHKVNDQRMFIELVNGSTWQVVGSDNFLSLVGSPPVGIVMSEFAKAKPQAWAYLSPAIAENDGWAVFNTTPMGKNHAYSMYRAHEEDPGAFAQVLSVADTEVFTEQQLIAERKNLISVYGETLGAALFDQEYHCSFEAAVLGSIYGDVIARLRASGRIRPVEHIAAPVYTAWDLGFTDATAVWFYQIVGGEVRVLDYFEASKTDLGEYVQQVTGREIVNPVSEWGFTRAPIQWGRDIPELAYRRAYDYAEHYFPHDAKNRTLVAGGVSIESIMRKALTSVTVLDMANTPMGSRLAMSRAALERSWIDTRAESGMETLALYRYEYDANRRILAQRPVHDWTSHGADAWAVLGAAVTQKLATLPDPHRPVKRANRGRGSAWAA